MPSPSRLDLNGKRQLVLHANAMAFGHLSEAFQSLTWIGQLVVHIMLLLICPICSISWRYSTRLSTALHQKVHAQYCKHPEECLKAACLVALRQ